MKTLSGMGRLLALITAASATLLQGSLLQGSGAAAQAPTATLHGHVTNPVGAALKTGDVKLTTDKGAEKDRTYKFDFPIDANGDYKGANIPPGDYLVVVMADGKTIDFQQVTLKGAQDAPLDFDMTRAEYLKSMTPEDRAKLEEYKKKNASITADNAKIANINKTLAQARLDEKNGKADDAVKALSDLTQQKPDEPVLWASLGEAQLASADAAAAAAKAAKTSPTDPAILQKYSDSATSYQKAIDLNANAKKPSPENLAASYLNLGQALAKSGKLTEAAAAYESSAKTLPSSAGSAYSNEAAIFFNAGKLDEAGAAADKAIQTDPKRPDPYYIKGQSLIPKATLDPKTNKFVLPPGCLEAYQEYLELAPTGKFAPEVKDLLNNLGQPVKNSFKAGKK